LAFSSKKILNFYTFVARIVFGCFLAVCSLKKEP
jgi:hypothetical protein